MTSEGTATTAQVKQDIDTGRSGDKVLHFDPAAAPLGTDEEAGGAPVSPAVVARERRRELQMGIKAQQPDHPGTGTDASGRGAQGGLGWPLLVILVIAAAAAGFLLLHGMR